MKNGVQFTHYRVARYFTEKSGEIADILSKETLDRFEETFSRLNGILKD
jgi:hypothetical protein